MDNPEKLDTQDEDRHNVCWAPIYANKYK